MRPDPGADFEHSIIMSVDPMTNEPIIPEIVEPDDALPRDLYALRRFAWLLDAAVEIPGTRRRFGAAPVLGLIPGVGDAIGGLLSIWIVVGALRHRVPGRKIGRMVANILIDLGIGAIPLLGDLFDFFFQENLSNVAILMRHRDRARPPRSIASIFFYATLISFVIAAAAVGAVLLAILIMLTIASLIPFP